MTKVTRVALWALVVLVAVAVGVVVAVVTTPVDWVRDPHHNEPVKSP